MILDQHRLRLLLPSLPQDVQDSIEAMFEEYELMRLDVENIQKEVDWQTKAAQEWRDKLEAYVATHPDRPAGPPSGENVGDAKKIRSKFAGKCKLCSGPVSINQVVLWTPGVQGVTHVAGDCR